MTRPSMTIVVKHPMEWGLGLTGPSTAVARRPAHDPS
jgi:hypothetical protein